MNKFEKGERVLIVDEENTVRKGVVGNAYDELSIAIVEFEDGAVEKIPYKWLGRIQEEGNDEPKPEDEGKSVKITVREFSRFLGEELADAANMGLSPTSIFSMTIHAAKLSAILFREENEITLTERKLRDAVAELILKENPALLSVVLGSTAIFSVVHTKIFGNDVVEK